MATSTRPVEEEYIAFTSICENSVGGLPGGLITADDIEHVTRKLKLRKAPGEDGITNEYIKYYTRLSQFRVG